MTHRPFVTTCAALLLSMATAFAFAQDQAPRVMGVVIDESGGALPGVTVSLNSTRPPVSVVTDSNGRYVAAPLVPGSYNISFSLSGFETRNADNVLVTAGTTVVLDQQLALAAMTETVQVTAAAPAPPAPEPVLQRPPVRRQPRPMPVELAASVCGPRGATDFNLAVGSVLSHRDEKRSLLGTGDTLRINAGEANGVATGQNLAVRRRFPIGDRNVPRNQQTFGEQTVGLVQVVETQADSAVAAVVYTCGEIMVGDTVERYTPQPAHFTVADGMARFDEPGRITVGDDGRQMAAEGQMMVIDRGIMQGAQRGQRLTIFRKGEQGARVMLGEGVILAVRADSATILIGKTVDAIEIGDLIALHR